MKKFFLLFILLTGYSAIKLFAQSTINSGVNPSVGDIIFNSVYTDSVYSPGPSGAGQSWDFSFLTPDYFVATYYFRDTSVTDSATEFPQDFPFANIASFSRDTNSIAGDSNFVYSNVSNTQNVYWGQESIEGKTTYTNGEILLTYPFSYSNAFVDTFGGQVVNASGTFNRTGIETVTADAYGTLKLPQGIFFNALRVNRKENITDSGTLGGDGTYRYSNETYTWYSPIYNNSLLTINFDTLFYTLLDSEYVFPSYSATFGTDTASAVRNINPSFSFTLFPNPTEENISIIAGAEINRITVSNMLGENVISLQEKYNIPNNPVNISLAGLPPGIYVCSVITPAGTLSRKIVKEQ